MIRKIDLVIPGPPKAPRTQPPKQHVVEQSMATQLQRYVPPPRKPRRK